MKCPISRHGETHPGTATVTFKRGGRPLRPHSRPSTSRIVSTALGLLGCGPSREDAIARFESEFAFLWDEIACESDDALLPQAQDLKRRLIRLVSSVKEAA